MASMPTVKQWTRSLRLLGNPLRETDIRGFVTLVRFELAYYGLFKCNIKPLNGYPAVYDYLVRLLKIPAFAASVRSDHIQTGDYSTKALNPSGIIPQEPQLEYLSAIDSRFDHVPHTRKTA